MVLSDNPWGEPDDQQERPLSAWYVTGFMDGEGCFCASIHRVPSSFGWYIGPVVQAYQHRDRADILERLQAFFGCGRIRPKGPNSSVVTWSVDGVPTIVAKVLPTSIGIHSSRASCRTISFFARSCCACFAKSIYVPMGLSISPVSRSG